MAKHKKYEDSHFEEYFDTQTIVNVDIEQRMREAFVYMFKDNYFGKKAILYFTLSFIASVCSAYALMHSCTGACPITTGNGIFIPNKTNTVIYQMLGFLFHLLILGYFNICINAITKQVNNIVLPFFNFTSSLLKGLKYFLAILLPVVSFALITGILQEINILAANIFLTIGALTAIVNEFATRDEFVYYDTLTASYVMLSIGAITTITSIPILCVGHNRQKKAINMFNEQNSVQEPELSLNLQASQNGIGLALNF